MILGALVDAGLAFEALRDELAVCPWTAIPRAAGGHEGGLPRDEDRGARPWRRPPRGDGRHGPGRGHEHPDTATRTGACPTSLTCSSEPLDPAVQAQAARVFRRLAEAEARVHGVAPEAVRFHDVGAVDAIVDVTGACLGSTSWACRRCTARRCRSGAASSPERTGDAGPGSGHRRAAARVAGRGHRRPARAGHPDGRRHPDHAGDLGRTHAADDHRRRRLRRGHDGPAHAQRGAPLPRRGRRPSPPGGQVETILQVETTVDDMSPQLWEPLVDTLFEAGALDVYLTPVLMKRSRPGVVLTALCPPAGPAGVARVLFRESTTIGVRWTAYQRQRLAREIVTVATAYGSVDFKVSRLDGRPVTATPGVRAGAPYRPRQGSRRSRGARRGPGRRPPPPRLGAPSPPRRWRVSEAGLWPSPQRGPRWGEGEGEGEGRAPRGPMCWGTRATRQGGG